MADGMCAVAGDDGITVYRPQTAEEKALHEQAAAAHADRLAADERKEALRALVQERAGDDPGFAALAELAGIRHTPPATVAGSDGEPADG